MPVLVLFLKALRHKRLLKIPSECLSLIGHKKGGD